MYPTAKNTQFSTFHIKLNVFSTIIRNVGVHSSSLGDTMECGNSVMNVQTKTFHFRTDQRVCALKRGKIKTDMQEFSVVSIIPFFLFSWSNVELFSFKCLFLFQLFQNIWSIKIMNSDKFEWSVQKRDSIKFLVCTKFLFYRVYLRLKIQTNNKQSLLWWV